jgi:serine/threonine protein kinase
MNAPGVGALVDGKYRLLRVIGEGGWGIVFEGENARTLKRVAIKILRARSDVTADIRARFEREAQAAGRIGSEHIVEVFDLGTLADGSHYMVMELLVGEDLATRLRSTGALPPVLAAKLALQLLDGLGAAHHVGILHRDLKPENLFLVPTRSGEDFVKILDFGISKFTTPGITSATMTGAVLGSPCYMAPEQARGLKHVDARTDLYSVGTLLYECVTGRVPFDGDNFNDLMFKIALAPRPNPLEFCPGLSVSLASIIVKAIAADPDGRFESAADFHAALVEWLDAQGVKSVRPPELRRAIKTTPHASGGMRSAAPATAPSIVVATEEAHWSDATAASPSQGSTPLAAAATFEPPRLQGRKHAVGVSLGAALLVGAVVGLAAFRHARKQAPSGVQPQAAAQMMPSLATGGTTAVPDPPPPSPAAPAAIAVTKLEPLAAQAPPAFAAPRGASRPPVWVGGHAPPPSRNAPNVAPEAPAPPAKSVDPSAVAPAPPQPPPPPPATEPAPKPADTVEGRAIRTGL